MLMVGFHVVANYFASFKLSSLAALRQPQLTLYLSSGKVVIQTVQSPVLDLPKGSALRERLLSLLSNIHLLESTLIVSRAHYYLYKDPG